MVLPSKSEYDKLSHTPSDKLNKSWADFTDNFLFKFIEGQSFSIWVFVSGVLIILYAKYASFKSDLLGIILQIISLSLLAVLILHTFFKNFIFSNPWGLGDKLRSLLKLSQSYKQKRWFAEVLGVEPRKLNLPIKVVNFRRIYSKVRIIDSGNGRWRAGFVFDNNNGTEEYIFHAYQDAGSHIFRCRIIEREPGKREITPDVNKSIGIENPHNFEFWVENLDNKFNFYINGIFVGSYDVAIDNVKNVILAAWSDDKLIKILFEDIEVLV